MFTPYKKYSRNVILDLVCCLTVVYRGTALSLPPSCPSEAPGEQYSLYFRDNFQHQYCWTMVDSYVQIKHDSCNGESQSMETIRNEPTSSVDVATHTLDPPARIQWLAFSYQKLSERANGGGIRLLDEGENVVLGIAMKEWRLFVDTGVEIRGFDTWKDVSAWEWINVRVGISWGQQTFQIEWVDSGGGVIGEFEDEMKTEATGIATVRWSNFGETGSSVGWTQDSKMHMRICALKYFKCAPGYNLNSTSGSCSPCPEGEFSSDGVVCRECRPGEFNDLVGSTQCFSCEPGKYSSVNSSVECIPCEPGRFGDTLRATMCEECPAGKYSPSSGSDGTTVCYGCPEGQGSGEGSEGFDACQHCPEGQFSRGEEDCKDCPEGKTSYSAGAHTCVPPTPSASPTATNTKTVTPTPTHSNSPSTSPSMTASVSLLPKIERLDENRVNASYSYIASRSIRSLLSSSYDTSYARGDLNGIYILTQNATSSTGAFSNVEDEDTLDAEVAVEHQSSLYRIQCEPEGGYNCRLNDLQFQLLTQVTSLDTWVGERLFRNDPMLWVVDSFLQCFCMEDGVSARMEVWSNCMICGHGIHKRPVGVQLERPVVALHRQFE
eukprot:gb/GECG01010093.1/.p1 GENE.gb/GECG01010093.1/~~gb/GECG01010093.1/.p1  ORF type:complete len:606 (+),score=44.43 gb/GECG01010093.1/:1-1818(+)